MNKMLVIFSAFLFTACSPDNSTHNLTVDESRRAQINAEAYFNQEHPASVDTAGNLVKKKGSFIACRPQDSNSNNLVTCTGMKPDLKGGFVQTTMYCGYNTGSSAVVGCNDKDQK